MSGPRFTFSLRTLLVVMLIFGLVVALIVQSLRNIDLAITLHYKDLHDQSTRMAEREKICAHFLKEIGGTAIPAGGWSFAGGIDVEIYFQLDYQWCSFTLHRAYDPTSLHKVIAQITPMVFVSKPNEQLTWIDQVLDKEFQSLTDEANAAPTHVVQRTYSHGEITTKITVGDSSQSTPIIIEMWNEQDYPLP